MLKLFENKINLPYLTFSHPKLVVFKPALIAFHLVTIRSV